MGILEISSSNKALEFINERIKNDNYRGCRSSQHNRYTFSQIVEILHLLNKYSPNKSLMTIRTTDIKKRPKNTEEEVRYANFCHEAKKATGIGSQDAMRKNLFVDFHRMGFIDRYKKDRSILGVYKHGVVKYISLSELGLKLINATNILDKYFIFSKGVDNLLGGYINTVLNILRNPEYQVKKISIYEYMFFVSAIGSEESFNQSVQEAVLLIREYQKLTDIQKTATVETLKQEMQPKNYLGSKKNKRDFYNWKNKIDQIYYLLNQTIYFECREEYLYLRGKKKNSIINEKKQLTRSINEKNIYFDKHNVSKTSGFELHHVIPLSWSENEHHFKIIDNWKNLVYIDGYSHSKITQNRNRNVKMEINKISYEVTLKDYAGNKVDLEYKKNILYKTTNQQIMEKYNDNLLDTVNNSKSNNL